MSKILLSSTLVLLLLMPSVMASDGSGCESAGWIDSPTSEVPNIVCYEGKIFEQNQQIISNQNVIKQQNAQMINQQVQTNELLKLANCYKLHQNISGYFGDESGQLGLEQVCGSFP